MYFLLLEGLIGGEVITHRSSRILARVIEPVREINNAHDAWMSGKLLLKGFRFKFLPLLLVDVCSAVHYASEI